MKNPRWLLVIGFVPGLAFKGLRLNKLENVMFINRDSETYKVKQIFLQMSMKLKGSPLLTSNVPNYNSFIKTPRK